MLSPFPERNQRTREVPSRWGLDNRVHCAPATGVGGEGIKRASKPAVRSLSACETSASIRLGELDPQTGKTHFGRNSELGALVRTNTAQPCTICAGGEYLRRHHDFSPLSRAPLLWYNAPFSGLAPACRTAGKPRRKGLVPIACARWPCS